jgi:ATP-dependent Clp protease adaptor protein ClpS
MPAVPTTLPEQKTGTRTIPPYNVVLHNDDDHSMDFVIEVLRKVLNCDQPRAYQLMLMAHTSGCSVIWTGPKEGAELKVEQVQTFHEVRERDKKKLGPLTVTIEPAPGA